MMSKPKGAFMEVFLDGQEEPLLVRIDQRDYAAWEAHPDHGEDRYTLMLRFLAWNGGKRSGQISADWKTFNTKLCIQALLQEAGETEETDDQEGEQRLDPGR